MLQKCANPACTVPFRSLHEGKLFLAENHALGSQTTCDNGDRRLRREHFWLCTACSSHFTLRFDNERGMVTVPLLAQQDRNFRRHLPARPPTFAKES